MRLRWFMGWMMAWALCFTTYACTKEDGQRVKEAAPLLIKGGCILIQALTDSGTIRTACATAEDLAPLIDEIDDARERGAMVAFSLPAAPLDPPPTARKRKPAKRRCAAWIDLTDGGSPSTTRASDASLDSQPQGDR